MNSFEKDVNNILENMYEKVEDAIRECDNRLIEISAGKSYKELSRALKSCSPVYRGVEYRVGCHLELLRRLCVRQVTEKIRVMK
ncbi:hypothetical protein HCA89_00235 [Listeria innocua]|uniref:Uncharacterized protein n=1 Tax=Listeria innocua TaxID=1642 RepID=A0AB73H3S0_LISIO|nr:hypothetical protein [Listeria innocua]MBC2140720.1 hypothetical protein [Listeria innocua]